MTMLQKRVTEITDTTTATFTGINWVEKVDLGFNYGHTFPTVHQCFLHKDYRQYTQLLWE